MDLVKLWIMNKIYRIYNTIIYGNITSVSILNMAIKKYRWKDVFSISIVDIYYKDLLN